MLQLKVTRVHLSTRVSIGVSMRDIEMLEVELDFKVATRVPGYATRCAISHLVNFYSSFLKKKSLDSALPDQKAMNFENIVDNCFSFSRMVRA